VSRWVFADTSGLVAWFLKADPYHDRAEREMWRLVKDGRRFLTTNYVFDELITRVRRLAGFPASRRIGQAILTSTLIRRIFVDEAEEAHAWRLYLKYRDQELSFTDATSFAVMKTFGLSEAFTLDRDFARVGFTVFLSPAN
jgi:predicted nucleic acid-binding protein